MNWPASGAGCPAARWTRRTDPATGRSKCRWRTARCSTSTRCPNPRRPRTVSTCACAPRPRGSRRWNGCSASAPPWSPIAGTPTAPAGRSSPIPRATSSASCAASPTGPRSRPEPPAAVRGRPRSRGLRQDARGACRLQPVGELLQQVVVELVVRDGLRGAAGVEEARVVDHATGRNGERVQFAQEGELVVVRIAEADELPEQGQPRGLAEIAFGGEPAGGTAVGLEDDQGGLVAAGLHVVVDHLVHGPVVVGPAHVTEVLVQLVDTAAVPAERQVRAAVDV